MTYSLELSALALDDLADVWEFYVSIDLAHLAQRRVDEIIERAQELRVFPEIGESRNGLERNLQKVRSGQHLIFYRIIGDAIVVRRVLHAKSDLEQEFE